MSDAYQCDKCGEFNNGSGIQMRYGVYLGTSSFKSNYDFAESAELCKECKKELDNIVSDYMSENNE